MIRVVDAIQGSTVTTDIWGGSGALQKYADTYSQVVSAISAALLPQTPRIKNYIDAIAPSFEGGNFHLDYSAVDQLLDNQYSLNPEVAMGDLVDLISLVGITKALSSWENAFPKLQGWVAASNYDALSQASGSEATGIRGLIAELGFTIGAGDVTGTEQSDRILIVKGPANVNAGAGDDFIVSGAFADVIDGGVGNDTIYGGDGNDTITDTDGSDTIDGGAGDDIINDQYSGDNVLRGGDGNDSITFSFSSNNTIEGGSGNDLIKADRRDLANYYSQVNTFAGGAGNDRFETNSSTDTYLFNRGDGQDAINDYSMNGWSGGVYYGPANDKIVFGAGIATGDVTAVRSGAHLVLKVNDPANPASTDQITIENWDNGAYRIEQVQFADGTSWTVTDLNNPKNRS